MPKTWDDTLEGHREAVRLAVMDATLTLADEIGFRKVSMSDVAGKAGITRATLYKYFRDVDSIFIEWHRRTVEGHMARIHEVLHADGGSASKLAAVLETYALTVFRHHGTQFAEFLHRGDHAKSSETRLVELMGNVIAGGALAGQFRRDVPPGELAFFCHAALSSVHRLADESAVRRVIDLTLEALSASGRS
jgi:AcrR family transcriptional regulator